jgi:hypothetical protein
VIEFIKTILKFGEYNKLIQKEKI